MGSGRPSSKIYTEGSVGELSIWHLVIIGGVLGLGAVAIAGFVLLVVRLARR